MNTKQKIAIITPLLLWAIMYPIFQLLSRVMEARIAWYLGLVIYWLIWGLIFSGWMLGKKNIRKIIRPQKPTMKIILLALFPLLMASLYKLVPGMDYEKPSLWIFLLLLSTNLGNGFFEELLWRGVYLCYFPQNRLFRIIWPNIGFALWHYIPGSVISNGNVIGLMIGSGLMGFYLSFLAKKTGTIGWGIIVHMVGGLIMIV